MSNNNLISVLLPVYNCEQYVEKAIQSILDQTYTNFELLIIDQQYGLLLYYQTNPYKTILNCIYREYTRYILL